MKFPIHNHGQRFLQNCTAAFFILLLQHMLQESLAATRLAIAEFRHDETHEAETTANMYKTAILVEFSKKDGVLLLERQNIDLLLEEIDLAVNDNELGHMNAAELVICGNVEIDIVGQILKVEIIEVSSGNVLASAGFEITNHQEVDGKIISDVIELFCDSRERQEGEEGKPSALIVNVSHTGRLNRLKPLTQTLSGLLESAVRLSGKYRLLGHRHSRVCRTETFISSVGWAQPSASVLAKHSDLLIHAELSENYAPNTPFEESTFDVTVTCSYRNKETSSIKKTGEVKNMASFLSELESSLILMLNESENTGLRRPTSSFDDAWVLMNEAINYTDLETLGRGFTTWPYRQSNIGHERIDMLQKALHIDPSLNEARLHLGVSLLDESWTNPNTSGKVRSLKQALNELETYIGLCKDDSLSLYAYQPAIRCCMFLGHLLGTGLESGKPREGTCYFMKGARLSLEYLQKTHSIDCREMYDVGKILFMNILDDTDKARSWCYHLDKYTINEGILLDLAHFLISKGFPDEAMTVYNKAQVKYSFETFEGYGPFGPAWELLADIHSNLGHIETAKQIRQEGIKRIYAEFEESERNSKKFENSFNSPPALLKLPEALMVLVSNLTITATARDSNHYYISGCTGYETSGFSEGGRILNTYSSTNTVVCWHTQRQTLAHMDISLPTGSCARVTCILPTTNAIWFGTHHGVCRYATDNYGVSWYTMANGLPSNLVTAGLNRSNILWFASRDTPFTLFSISPSNDEVRVFLPPEETTWVHDVVVDIKSTGNNIGVVTSAYTYSLNPQTGKWSMCK